MKMMVNTTLESLQYLLKSSNVNWNHWNDETSKK